MEDLCGWLLCQSRGLMSSEGSLFVRRVTSSFRATTAGSWTSRSIDQCPGSFRFVNISCAYRCPNNRSARLLLKRSTISRFRWVSTRTLQTYYLPSTLCFANKVDTVSLNSRPGPTCSSLGHRKGFARISFQELLPFWPVCGQGLRFFVARGYVNGGEGVLESFAHPGRTIGGRAERSAW